MNGTEKKSNSHHGAVSALLLLFTGAMILLIALFPTEPSKEQKGTRLAVADEYRTAICSRLDLIVLSDVTEETVAVQPEESVAPVHLVKASAAPEMEAEAPVPMVSEKSFQNVPETVLAETVSEETTSERIAPEEIEPVQAAAEPEKSEPVPTDAPETEPAESEPVLTEAEETAPAQTEPAAQPKKHYRIPETAVAAPVPNPACYGEVDTPAEMSAILEQAANVLEGQEMYFSTDVELYLDSKIYYYLDETIFSVVWKQKIDNAVFTFAETKVMDPTQFRRYLSGGEFGSGKLMLTSEMSRSVNAVVGCSADFYAYRYEGVAVVDGVVHKCRSGVKDTCFVDYNGDLIPVQNRIFGSTEELQNFVDENNIQFSLSFGPVLVKDGEFCCPREYRPGEVYGKYPRAAICQMDRLHYLFVASNRESMAPNMLPMMKFANYVAETGCLQAYAVDGGQTATVVMNNEVRNHVNYGSERPISDIIYFSTAKPTEEGNP